MIRDRASGLLGDSNDAPLISVHFAQPEPTQAMAASHHLVVAVGAEQSRWDDLSISSKSEARALVSDRLVPWVTRWQEGRRAPRARTADLADPHPGWAQAGTRLVARLRAHTADRPVVRIDHIGSTAVPGLPAKDLIDIQITVPTDAETVDVARAATNAGFVHVAGQWFGRDRHGAHHLEQVCVDADPGRPVNINIRSATRPVARDALLFRDWLRANPTGRDGYLAHKTELQGLHVDEYSDRKEPFISVVLEQAEAWASRTGWEP